MVNKLKIQQLINQNEFNKALEIIDNLENNYKNNLEKRLVYRCFKCQVLGKTGKTEKGLELAIEILTMVQNQVPGNQLLQVDAIITKIEALRLANRFSKYYSSKKMSEYLKLIEKGERILLNISNLRQVEKTQRKAILLRNKGIIYRSLGELDRAEKYFQESVLLHQKIGNKKDINEIMTDLSTIFGIKKEYDRQLQVNKDCLNISEELGDREAIAENLLHLASVYQNKGEPETAYKYVLKSLILASELPKTHRVASLLFWIGNFYQVAKDKIDDSLDAYQKSLSMCEELNDEEGIISCLHLLGDLYQYSKGELNRASKYYEKSLKLFGEIGNLLIYSWNLLDLGNLYHLKGDLDLALSYFQKALPLLEEIDNDFFYYQSFLHIGRVYRSKGDKNTASDYYRRCLKLLKERTLLYGQETEGLAYYELIAVMIDKRDINAAKKYFELFKQYYEKNKQSMQFLNQWYKLSEALILKTSIRIKDKARAQQLFQEIIDDEGMRHDLLNFLADPKKTATLNLCELLLFELKSSPDLVTKENEVFQEVKHLLQNLSSFAQKQNSFPLLIDVTILQARLSLIEGNLKISMHLLNQAKITAEKNELPFLLKRVSGEEKYLKNQLDVWQNLIKKNAPLQERLAQAQIEEYLLEAKKMVNLTHQSFKKSNNFE